MLLTKKVLQVRRNAQIAFPFVHQNIVLFHPKPGTIHLAVPHQFILLVCQSRRFPEAIVLQRSEVVEVEKGHIESMRQARVERQAITVAEEETHRSQVLDEETQR